MSARPSRPVRERYSSTISPAEPIGLLDLREHEHRASEAAAEQARAEAARRVGELDEQVELGDRDLVVVAEARVARDRAGARRPRGRLPRTPPRTAPPARSRSPRDAAAARRPDRGPRDPTSLTCVERSAPTSASACSSSARRCAYPVRLEAPLDPRVDDHERGLLGHRDEAVLERRAVEEDRRARLARAGTPPGRGSRTGRRPRAARRAGTRARARAARARTPRPRTGRARSRPRARPTTRARRPWAGPSRPRRRAPPARGRAPRALPRRPGRSGPSRSPPLPSRRRRTARRRRQRVEVSEISSATEATSTVIPSWIAAGSTSPPL